MGKKPKIVMLISNANPGGVFTSTSLLVKNIDRSKFQVIAVACGSGAMADKIGSLADEYYNLNVGTFPRVRKMVNEQYREDYFAWAKLFIWLLRCIWQFTKWLYKHKPAIIHSNGTHFDLIAGISGRLARVPSIWHIRFPANTAKNRNFLVGLVEGPIAAKLPTRIIANSNYTATTFHKTWQKKTKVVWNAIDVSSIRNHQQAGKLRQMANVGHGDKLIGAMGLISHRKGMDRFVEVASLIVKERNDVKFVIVGGAPQEMEQMVRTELIKLANDKGLFGKLFFAGDIPNAAYCMGDMNVLFMCSRPGTESFGLVVIEAMAASVPVVAFANDAMPEIIEDGRTGFLVLEGDIENVKDRVLKILDDLELAENLRTNALKRIYENFDYPILTGNIIKVYEDVLGISGQDVNTV